MKKKYFYLMTLFTSLIFGFAGFTLFGYISNNNIIKVHASWGDELPTIEALIEESDLIIVGTLEKELESYQPFENMSDTFTDAIVKVNHVLKGEPISEIILSQYGGIRPDNRIELFEELPLIEKDKYYLMFLKEIKDNTKRNGKYQYVRGIQGFYYLQIDDPGIKSSLNNREVSIEKIANKITIDAPLKAGITQKVSQKKLGEILNLTSMVSKNK